VRLKDAGVVSVRAGVEIAVLAQQALAPPEKNRRCLPAKTPPYVPRQKIFFAPLAEISLPLKKHAFQTVHTVYTAKIG
jgi:hypothetical protein